KEDMVMDIGEVGPKKEESGEKDKMNYMAEKTKEKIEDMEDMVKEELKGVGEKEKTEDLAEEDK
ncbi:hypothetical protein A2U01_0075061, partial [Trifolium medium]|nr:hypothetical protein [Trifolium medium]